MVLYVDDRCPFCAEELRRWYAASGGDLPEGLVIVRHPAQSVDQPGVVPAAWASMTLLDPDGVIAGALGVTAVPFIAFVGEPGTVTEITMGLTPEGRIAEQLTSMRDPRFQGDPHE